MPKMVHFEIPVDDPDRASAFYRETFGWEISGFGEMPFGSSGPAPPMNLVRMGR